MQELVSAPAFLSIAPSAVAGPATEGDDDTAGVVGTAALCICAHHPGRDRYLGGVLLEQARSSSSSSGGGGSSRLLAVVLLPLLYYYHTYYHLLPLLPLQFLPLEQNICAWAVAGAVLSSPLAVRVRQARGALDPSTTANEALATALAARSAWELAVTKGGQARPSMVGLCRRQTWVWGLAHGICMISCHAYLAMQAPARVLARVLATLVARGYGPVLQHGPHAAAVTLAAGFGEELEDQDMLL